MLQPVNKEILAPPKHSVLYEASQSIVCFQGLSKAQCRKMDIFTFEKGAQVKLKSYELTDLKE
jgi:hypothetical protein